jgi:hypothetical protein
MIAASALWRRQDTPGHDACHLEQHDSGWRLQGMTVFRQDGGTARLTYDVRCDRAWRSQEGRVLGWFNLQPIDISIARTREGLWTVNGEVVRDLERCIDLDFGFTPATNVFQLRRLALAPGRAADTPAAWLDASSGTFLALPQRYERRTETTYWYEAPTVEYANELEVTPIGFISRYPHLWELEP